MLNHITIMGRLTRDPELRTTQSGVSVTSFSLAVERDYQRGGNEDKADFIDCVAFRQTAEFVSKYFRRGQLAVMSGRLQSRKYTDRSGASRTAWEVTVETVHFGGDKKSDTNGSDTAPAQQTFTELDDGDGGELPFE